MMRFSAVVAHFTNLDATELERWIAHRWVRPEPAGEDWVFHDIDLARIRLVYDLRYELDVTEDCVPLVLDLLDQIYELRSGLSSIGRAIAAQPPEIRQAIEAAIAGDRESPPRIT